MITNYLTQKEQSQQRSELKTQEHQFENIIAYGTSCSLFESEVILRTAKEVFKLGDYSNHSQVFPGQIMWMAVSGLEPAGKPIAECKLVSVKLTLIDQREDDAIYKKYGLSYRRQIQIARISDEARVQGGLLSQEDIARLLGHDVRTIRRDIAELKKRDIVVPTRGQQKDIGPGVTHREKAVELYLQGCEPGEIGNRIKHTLKAVERYVDTFCRVVYCQQQFKNTHKTAMVIGISVSLVNKYWTLYYDYRDKKEYKDRLKQVIARGNQYTEMIDFKKKSKRKQSRRKRI